MELETVAKALKELGHPTRLQIYRCLVKAGAQGMPVGSLQGTLEIPGSTLNHHLSGLRDAGLVLQVREGRVLNCIADYARLDGVIDYLARECCRDEEDKP